MKIICGKLNGFCAGVNYTIKKAKELLENTNETIYCLGEIIHNERVIESLENKGMVTIDDINEAPNNSKVIFRAHGEAKEIYEIAKTKNIEVFDLTCGKIKIIRNKIEKNKDDSFIIIIGKKNHPETIGNISFTKPFGSIVETIDDINSIYEEFKLSNLNKVYIIAQTTFSSIKFDEYVNIIQDTFKEPEIIVDKTICDATENRQKEANEISKNVDKMIIVGGKHSSNTKELAKITEKNCESYLIQTIEDLSDIDFNSNDTIGIISGASTPLEVIDEIIEYLNNLFN